jgi:hypothetical protein
MVYDKSLTIHQEDREMPDSGLFGESVIMFGPSLAAEAGCFGQTEKGPAGT